MGVTLGLSACSTPPTAHSIEKNPKFGWPYSFSAAQRAAVQATLQRHPEWRLAISADNRSELLPRQVQDSPGYEPYYLKGDFDGDSDDDFALVLIRRGNWGVVWYRNLGRDYSAENWLLNETDLGEGGLFPFEGGLMVGGCFYCDAAVPFVWDAKQQTLIELPAGETD